MTEVTDEVGTAFIAAVGEYLRNVVRESGVTCRVCAAPVDGFDRCWRCNRDSRIAGLADVVVPLTYAIGNTQSANILHRYKNHPIRTVREEHTRTINRLLHFGLSLHERCIARVAGLPVSRLLVVPSLTGRPGQHPFSELAHAMNAVSDAVTLVAAPDATCDRAINSKFALQPAARLDRQHVLILDDVWTTGSNAQSAALTVRHAGAAAVSVMVIGRWLSPDRPVTANFIATRLQRQYDPNICPVTGAHCP